MAINPAIAMSFQAPKFEDPMNRLVQMEQLKAYQQNALAKQMEMESAKETMEQQKGLRNYLAGMQPGQAPSLNEMARFGKQGVDYFNTLSEAQKRELESATKLYKDIYLPRAAGIKTVKDAFMWRQSLKRDPRIASIVTQEGDFDLPETEDEVPGYVEDLLVPFQKQYETKAAKERSDAAIASRERLATEQRESTEEIARQNRQLREDLAAREGEFKQKRLTLDERKQNWEERKNSPEMQQSLAAAREFGKKMSANEVDRQQALPGVIRQAEIGLGVIDRMLGDSFVDNKGKIVVNKVKDEQGNEVEGREAHPGFSGTVGAGVGFRFLPGTSESDFQRMHDQITGQAFLQAYETLKGGGQITNIEGEKATSALNRMNVAQSEEEYIIAAREFESIIKDALTRAKSQLGGPQAASQPALPKDQTGGNNKERKPLGDFFN